MAMAATAATAKFSTAYGPCRRPCHHAPTTRQRLRLQDVVDDDLDRPGFENGGERLAQDGDERQRQGLPVRPDEVDDPQRRGRSVDFADDVRWSGMSARHGGTTTGFNYPISRFTIHRTHRL